MLFVHHCITQVSVISSVRVCVCRINTTCSAIQWACVLCSCCDENAMGDAFILKSAFYAPQWRESVRGSRGETSAF